MTTVDPKCHELAEQFLADHPSLKGREPELAGGIQQFIEDWIEETLEEMGEGADEYKS